MPPVQNGEPAVCGAWVTETQAAHAAGSPLRAGIPTRADPSGVRC